MSKLKIVGFASYDSDYPTINFKKYSYREVEQLVIDEISDKKYLYGGDVHQNNEFGCPVFNNGTMFRCSMRMWAIIMSFAHINFNKDGTPNYMFYYMNVENPVLPTKKATIKLDKEEINNGALPTLSKFDIQLILETLSCGIDTFVTDDKAIKKVFPYYKNYMNSFK